MFGLHFEHNRSQSSLLSNYKKFISSNLELNNTFYFETFLFPRMLLQGSTQWRQMTNQFLFNCSYFSLHSTLSTSNVLSGTQSISGETRWNINKIYGIQIIYMRCSTHRNYKNYDIFTAGGCNFSNSICTQFPEKSVTQNSLRQFYLYIN